MDIYSFGLTLAELFFPSGDELKHEYFTDLKTCEGRGASPCVEITQLIPVSLLYLILRMLATEPADRPTASQVHSELLNMYQKILRFPIYHYEDELLKNSHLRELPSFLVQRPELSELLQVYDKGKESVVFLTGHAGSGKTTVTLPFIETLMNRGGHVSIFFFDIAKTCPIKNKLEWMGNRLRGNIYKDGGTRVTVSC